MKKITAWVEKNKILSLFVNREVFTLCYLTVCLLLSFPLLISAVSLVAKVCFLWGVGLIGWDLLTKRRLFRSPCWLLPLLILAAYGVTVLLHRDVLVVGVKHWLHLAISFFLLYTGEPDADEKRLLCTVKRGFVIVNLLTFVGSIASLVMFALQTQVMLERGEETYKQGFYENRLYGVYASPNPGALLAFIAVAGVVFLFLVKDGKKLKCRWFFIANTVIQFVYFSLTLSKGGLLSVTAFAAVLAAFVAAPRLAGRYSPKKTVFLILLIFSLAVGVNEGAMRAVRFGMSYVPGFVLSEGDTEEGESTIKRILIERVEEGNETSAIRMDTWSGGWKIVRQDLLFGVSDANVDETNAAQRFDLSSLTEIEKDRLYQHNGYFHNVVIQILVYSGAVGLLLFAVFALALVFRLLRTLLLAKKATPIYDAVAVLTAVVAGLAVNGVSEAHLVYHRQDPIGLLFWFFLGAAVVLADRHRKSPEGVRQGAEDRVALMASTPYQVLNCLTFVQRDLEGSRGHADLYLAHPFRDSESISANLKQCGVFNNVYDINAFEKYDSLKGKLSTFFRLFFPEPALRRMAGGRLPVKAYDRVGASSQTSASIALRRTYPAAEMILYDDGVGSYYGSMVRDYNSAAFNLLNALFFNGGLNLDPARQYLTNPAMSENEVGAPVLALPPVGKAEASVAEDVFAYRPNDDYRDKAVYLTQPLEEWPEYRRETEEEILRLVSDVFGDRAVGRVHPRQTLSSLGGIRMGDGGNLWELECVRQITDDTVLIGAFSTAQLTPKLLCDREPYVIFTYRLLASGAAGPQAEKILRLIARFQASYREPGRVCLPETMEELEGLLRSIKA